MSRSPPYRADLVSLNFALHVIQRLSARAICVLLANCRSKVTYFKERKRTTYLEMPVSHHFEDSRTSSARSSRLFSLLLSRVLTPVALPSPTATISSLPAHLVLLFRLSSQILRSLSLSLSLSFSLSVSFLLRFHYHRPTMSMKKLGFRWTSIPLLLRLSTLTNWHPRREIVADRFTNHPFGSLFRDTPTVLLVWHLYSFVSSIHCHPSDFLPCRVWS